MTGHRPQRDPLQPPQLQVLRRHPARRGPRRHEPVRHAPGLQGPAGRLQLIRPKPGEPIAVVAAESAVDLRQGPGRGHDPVLRGRRHRRRPSGPARNPATPSSPSSRRRISSTSSGSSCRSSPCSSASTRSAARRKAGTLKLMLANPVSAGQVLLGKWLGNFLSLAVPFLLVDAPRHRPARPRSGHPLLGGPGSAGSASSCALTLVYIAFFLSLGMLVSALTRRGRELARHPPLRLGPARLRPAQPGHARWPASSSTSPRSGP